MRGCLTLVVALALALCCSAQPPGTLPAADGQGTYLGVLVSPVPEVLYDQLPQLPRNRGVVITHILPDSPAAQVELKKHDILLAYNGKPIDDCEQLARLLRADKPTQKIKLTLLRAGREATVEPTLGLGPVLTIAHKDRPDDKGIAKPEAPGKVSVSVTPLPANKMSVTIEYYDEGKLRSVTRSGSSAEIDKEMQKLPARVQDLARAALHRIRVLEAHR